MIALNFQPVDGTQEISIQDLIQNKDALVAGNTTAVSDQIQVWDGSKFDVYFYRAKKTTNPKFTAGPAWVKTTAQSTVSPDIIPSGKGFWYARPSDQIAGVLEQPSPIAPTGE